MLGQASTAVCVHADNLICQGRSNAALDAPTNTPDDSVLDH
jgi:hypothetical protein